MIKFENTEVWGFRHAIRGMRNPLASHNRSDSYTVGEQVLIGEKDLELMQKLIKGGTEHRKFLRQIQVSVDITAPMYWWKEYDTYKIGTTANSYSTMHTIHKKKFEKDDFSHEHLNEFMLYRLEQIVADLNHFRNCYNDKNDKDYWWQLIQILPSSYNQKRTLTMNYENLISMYHQRKSHKLDEWNFFCEWVETLPYAEELLIGKGDN